MKTNPMGGVLWGWGRERLGEVGLGWDVAEMEWGGIGWWRWGGVGWGGIGWGGIGWGGEGISEQGRRAKLGGMTYKIRIICYMLNILTYSILLCY